MGGSWMIYDYYNKTMVNQNDSDICVLVRQHYPTTIHANYPCDLSEKDNYWLVTFNENPGSASSAPTFITFKVDKKTIDISSGYDIK